MPVLTYQEARKEIAGGKVPGVILLHGEEEYLERDLIGLLRQTLETDQGGLDFLEWDEGTGEEERFTSLATLPWGARRRLIVANSPASASAKSYLRMINPSLVLVLLYHSRVKQNELIYKKISLQGWVIHCAPLRGRELTERLQEEAQLYHKVLTPQAAEYLHFLCGDNLYQLCHEIDKVSLYLGKEGRDISVPALQEVGSRTTQRSIFELVDAVSERRPRQVKEIVEELLQRGESPVLLTVLLSRHFLQLLEMSYLLEERVVPQRVAEVMAIHPYVSKKMLSQLTSLSTGEIEAILNRLLDLDRSIKRGQGAPELLLEAALSDICMKKPLARHSKR